MNYEYEKGLNDAWTALKWCANIPESYVDAAIGDHGLALIVSKYTPQEVIKKIKEYEEKQEAAGEIEVGDEIICYGTYNRKVVLGIKSTPTTTYYYCYGKESGPSMENTNCMPIKTGRHFDQIAEILEKIQEEEDK